MLAHPYAVAFWRQCLALLWVSRFWYARFIFRILQLFNELQSNLGRGLRRFLIGKMGILQSHSCISTLVTKRTHGRKMFLAGIVFRQSTVAKECGFRNLRRCALWSIRNTSQCRGPGCGQDKSFTATSIRYRPAHQLQKRWLTSFFFLLLTGSGVSRSGDAAIPAARFLTLITTLVRRERLEVSIRT